MAHQLKQGNNNHDILGLKIDGEILSDDSVLVESFNDYFTNIAVKLKEPLWQTDFTKLRDFINSKIPEDISFELPEIREHFVFTFLARLGL